MSRANLSPASRVTQDTARSGCYGIIGTSKQMQDVLDAIRRIADCSATVLLHGESGTGKEVVARAIHEAGPRRGSPFVVINCATIVDTLMESELFGHERGAFTGAHERKTGKFESADQGTVFLDEVAELPLPLQPKLLRIIQEREFTRVGGAKPITVDLRIIAATNRDLRAMVSEQTFREDLYYRLKVLQIPLAPLRQRPEDIPPLANHFLKMYAERYRRSVEAIDTDAVSMLLGHAWPGNVRDLEHVIERSVVMCDRPVIGAGDVIFEDGLPEETRGRWDYETALGDFNRLLLTRVLASADGNKRKAARKLGITHARLYRLLKKHGLNGAGEEPRD